MAHIEDTLAPHFTGHVGPVRFRRGHAETDDAELVEYFRGQPERYVVTETDEPARPSLKERQVSALERGMPHGLVAQITEDDDDSQE